MRQFIGWPDCPPSARSLPSLLSGVGSHALPHRSRAANPLLRGWSRLARRLELHQWVDVRHLLERCSNRPTPIHGLSLHGDHDARPVTTEPEDAIRRSLDAGEELLGPGVERMLDDDIDLEVHRVDRSEQMFVKQRVLRVHGIVARWGHLRDLWTHAYGRTEVRSSSWSTRPWKGCPEPSQWSRWERGSRELRDHCGSRGGGGLCLVVGVVGGDPESQGGVVPPAIQPSTGDKGDSAGQHRQEAFAMMGCDQPSWTPVHSRSPLPSKFKSPSPTRQV